MEQTAYNSILALGEGRRVRGGVIMTSFFNNPRFVNLANELLNTPRPNAATLIRYLRSDSRRIDNMIDVLLMDRFGQ